MIIRHPQPPTFYGPRPAVWFVGDGCTCSPDGLFGLDWSEACRWHDWAYRYDTDVSRLAADWYFLRNLRVCGCPRRWAVWYFIAVRVCGWRHFNKKHTVQ